MASRREGEGRRRQGHGLLELAAEPEPPLLPVLPELEPPLLPELELDDPPPLDPEPDDGPDFAASAPPLTVLASKVRLKRI